MARARHDAPMARSVGRAGRDPRRRPLLLFARSLRALGRDANIVPHGILLSRDAPRDRPADGWRRACRRTMEFRSRQSQSAAAVLDAPAARTLRARRDHARGAGARGAALFRTFWRPRHIRMGDDARGRTGSLAALRRRAAPALW